MSAPLLEIRGLEVVFPTRGGLVRAVDGVDLEVFPGECLGVVGESGSGKSVTFMAVLGLLRPPGRIAAGEIRFAGRTISNLPEAELRDLRGRAIAITLQDALTALNPALTVEQQISETIETHDPDLPRGRARRRILRDRALELLRLVGIPEPARRLETYPHELSGGMRQRVMIAIALSCRPQLLIADEPTTALDVTIQAQVLDLLAELRERLGTAMVLISHDLGVVAEHCARVVVMYAGQVVERGPTAAVIGDPHHPYTQGLLRSIPSLEAPERPIRPIPGQMADPIRPPPGCRFAPRCGLARPACRAPIALRPIDGTRAARCIEIGDRVEVAA